MRHLVRPVDRAGCYAPGGRARYPSTVLMCAVPGPGGRGRGDRAVRAAGPRRAHRRRHPGRRRRGRRDEVYRSAGPRPSPPWPTAPRASPPSTSSSARATATWPRPSGRWPAWSAWPRPSPGPRRWWWSPGRDTPPEFAAIDLVVQAEHGPDGLAWLITWSEELVDQIDAGGRPDRGRLAPAGRPRGHPGRRAATPCWSTAPSRPGGGQRGRPRAPRAPHGRRRVAARAASRRPAPSSSGPTPRPAWATTWPDPTTCCPPTGRPGSPAPCGSTTSASTSTR